MNKTKTQRALCLLTALVLLSLLLTACSGSKLSGTYYNADGIISQSFTFHGDQVTMSAFGINATGTYKIEGDKITIHYSLFGIPYDWQQPFSKSGNSIYIGGTQFIKK